MSHEHRSRRRRRSANEIVEPANLVTVPEAEMDLLQNDRTAARVPRWILPTILALGGVLLAIFGWLIPLQFKSLPVSVLAEAGRGTPGLADEVAEQLDAGRPGLAEVLAKAAVAVKRPNADELVQRVDRYLERNPDLAVLGEANPYLTSALPKLATQARSGGQAGIIRQILPAPARAALREFISGSRNATTQAILASAELPSYQEFLPVFSAGGAPLEATILLAAVLVESDELGGAAARELRALAETAARTGDAAELELFYLDLLSLGRRYNWGQLAAITREASSLEALGKLRHLHQVAPGEIAAVIAAVVVSGRPDAVADYVMRYGPLGSEAVGYALHHGSGSLAFLLRQQLPPDGELTLPPPADDSRFVSAAIDPLVRLSLRSHAGAVAAKFGAYLLGGLLLFLAVERVTALHRLELSTYFTLLARCIGAGVVCLLLLVFNEPFLAFGSDPSGYELRLVVPVLGTTSVESMNESTNALPLDTATLVSIAFFFMLQALVYVICLLKIKDIERQPVSEMLKLKMAENEENLFDSGLYVGIAGTSAALVLQVIGVIQANLLAAYSSNLFGILCVALIKIRHVRPFKHRILLRIADGGGSDVSRAG